MITGGARGLGCALATAFAARGAEVAFSYHASAAEAERTERALAERGGRVFRRRADARVPGAMAAFVEEAAQALGGSTCWSTTPASSAARASTT